MQNRIMMAALVLLGVALATFLLLFHKYTRLRLQKTKRLEEQERHNREITQMLEQKELEIERKSRELYETNTELKWQTENALRLYDEIELQKREMTDSLTYAKRIQSVLMPERGYINEILNDYFVLFKPRDIVSGDFYWVSAKSAQTVVVVADCTGHGVPGAFMSILGINFLNTITQEDNLHADLILNRMRDQVIKALKQTGKDLENKDGMDMALCIIDWENARIEYSGANIPLVMLRSTPETPHELTEIRADRMPIGIYENVAKPFTRHSMPIMPGDSIYMFSDGYYDQFGGEDLKKFKRKNLTKLLSEIHTHSMAEQKKLLKCHLEKWQGDLPQVDDILVMGIKI